MEATELHANTVQGSHYLGLPGLSDEEVSTMGPTVFAPGSLQRILMASGFTESQISIMGRVPNPPLGTGGRVDPDPDPAPSPTMGDPASAFTWRSHVPRTNAPQKNTWLAAQLEPRRGYRRIKK
jgi:hypothetical protein